MNFHVRKLNATTFDVFEGNQHSPEHWSRLRSGRNGVYVAQGRSLAPALTKQLAANINPRLQMQEISLAE